MEYLVLEIKADAASATNEGKVFKSISEAVKYVKRLSNAKKVFVNGKDKDIDQLEWLLAERLSSIVITTDLEDKTQWVITAF